MKKFTFLKMTLLFVVATLGSFATWAQTEVTYTFSEKGFANAAVLTSGTIETNLDYLAEKNSASNAPTYYDSGTAVRFYANSAAGNGGSYTVSTKNGVTITALEIYAASASYAPSVMYNVDGGSDVAASLSGSTYTITGISATTSLRFRNAITSATTQLRVTGFKVTYTGGVSTPAITVTETSIPEMTAEVGGTPDTETINVSGANLTEDISLAVSGTDAAMFSVSPASITQSGGNASGTVTVTYTPTAEGSHSATLEISSAGATTVTRTLSGTATYPPLATPTATAATSITQTGFTANWDAVSGADSYALNVYTKTVGANATDLFFSEYIEGSSYNKAIEIFNGTGSAVDLSSYSIKKQSNGSGTYGDELVLSGTLANNDVYVIAYVSGGNSSNAAILAVTDLQTNSGALSFNGNDAVGLFKSGTQIDEIGVFNQTSDWGKDVTLVRNNNIVSPIIPYNSTEWASNTTDETSYLGSHTMAGGTTTTPISGSPFTVTGTSHNVTGLTNNTTYYYTLTASNANVTSDLSNEIEVTTSPATGLDNTTVQNIFVADGKIRLNAIAGETIDVFNVAGQRIVSRLATEGLNTVEIGSKGILIVKVGNRVSKVMVN
ncbi:MAG: lamin tail domain-containing protein [Paludibacteraceae bacterium]